MPIRSIILAMGALLLLATPAAAQDFKLGGITVTAPWTRATPGGAKVAGAFLEIRAEPGVEDKLDRKSTRLNSSHGKLSRMPSSA